MVAALERQGELILSFRGRGAEFDGALEFRDGFVVLIVRRISLTQFRGRHWVVGSHLGRHGQFRDRGRHLLLHQQRHSQMQMSPDQLRIELNRLLKFPDSRRPASLLSVERAQSVMQFGVLWGGGNGGFHLDHCRRCLPGGSERARIGLKDIGRQRGSGI